MGWDTRSARAYLAGVAEPPAPALVAFVAEHGPVTAAESIRSGAAPPRVRKETDARRTTIEPDRLLEAATREGIHLLIPEDPGWPAWPFTALGVATRRGATGLVEPLALWVRGDRELADLAERSVAIVGARAATGYGERVAAEFGCGLAEQGVTVTSGAAYGIDGAAHRGAVAGGGATVAILACGLDVGYPAGHVGLLRRIAADHGVVLSEYGPGVPPARHRFLVRNRLIAALSDATVVVEAGARSGARNTAATAAALGRLVLAVPGPITSAMSAGCHAMIRDGALLAGSVAEVVEATGRLGLDLAAEAARPVRPTDQLDSPALRVYEACASRHGVAAEDVAVASGIDLGKVRAMLPELEIRGLIERSDEGWRQCERGP